MSYHPIKLDKVRNFKYGMKAISLIEKKFKKPISQIDMDNLTMEETAIIIWAGLYHEDDNLTPDKVMDLVDEHSDFVTIIDEMSKALFSAFGYDEKLLEELKQEEIKAVKQALDKSVKEANEKN